MGKEDIIDGINDLIDKYEGKSIDAMTHLNKAIEVYENDIHSLDNQDVIRAINDSNRIRVIIMDLKNLIKGE